MSLFQIAAKNLWQSRSRYLAYLGSTAFSVMIYFLYTALKRHPSLQSGFRGAAYIAVGMKGATVVIAVFTFLFLLYSNSAFVRSRLKEFGLLSLMGLSRRQLAGLILAESLLIGSVATLIGLGAGLLFERLFFMAISALLRLAEQIPFYVGAPVWLETVGLFGSFFVLATLASLRSVLKQEIIGLVRAARQPKGTPTFSRPLAALGLLLMTVGYAWASLPDQATVFFGVLPVTALVSVGTFLLMKEGSIAFLAWLHRRERFFYRPGPFLNVSQLVYKVQENYRVLSAVALLVAVILSAVGTITTLYVLTARDAIGSHPHALQILGSPGAVADDLARVESVLQKHGVTGLSKRELVTRLVRYGQASHATLVPYSFYASVERPEGKLLTLENPDEAIRVSQIHFGQPDHPSGVTPFTVTVDDEEVTLQVRDDATGRVLNPAGQPMITLVVSDERFAAMMARTPMDRQVQYHFWSGPTWRSRAMQKAVDQLRSVFEPDGMIQVDGVHFFPFSATVDAFQTAIRSSGTLLFVGLFVSLIFFASTFSLLYFRLFTEMEEDRRYFRRLQQLGVSIPELKRLALRQAAVIFLVPFLAGLIHSTFAMHALGTLAARNVLLYGWAVALGYLVLYTIGFAGAYAGYWRSLQAGLSAREA